MSNLAVLDPLKTGPDLGLLRARQDSNLRPLD